DRIHGRRGPRPLDDLRRVAAGRDDRADDRRSAGNSLVAIPAQVHSAIALATQIMLTMGLAAMGLQADISQLRSRGLRPLALAFCAFLFIGGFSLMLVKLA
ncbi:putative sulfate exporter family transporter, partial [Mesorhizobium sp. M4B.F.Ca.ET.169.01.1.1]|uniref:putative sulfate exporter family transporter n=1 Tax=Mesorhizobium sp. M4B.F.Ca.ET.169.01.1.1 TaxID=2563949 RepID=UPI001FE17D44